MAGKQKQGYLMAYVLIVAVCALIGLLIWFLFQLSLSDLDEKKDKLQRNESHQSIN
jgi:L-cystine uptake protein TcyP (sodium:dicarboxylate symporter family)